MSSMHDPILYANSSGNDSPMINTDPKSLQQQINKNAEEIKKLQSIIKQAEESFNEIDKILLEHAKQWLDRLESFIKNLATQLEENGISLTDEEKQMLKDGISSITEIRNRIKKLKEMGLKIDDDTAYYVVAAYDSVVTAMSRQLKQINEKEVTGKVKNLSVLNDEKKEVQALSKKQAEAYGAITQKFESLSEKIKESRLLSSSQVALLEEKIAVINRPSIKQIGPTIEARLE